MRTLAFTLLGLLSFQSFSYADCTDLSHQWKAGSNGLYRVKQIGCDKLERRIFDGDEQIGAPDVVDLNGLWKEDQVDDSYDKFQRKNRWTWNKDQSVLTMETIIDGLDKSSGEKYLTTRIDIYSKVNSGISIESHTLTRKESSSGEVTVSPSQKTIVRDPL